MLTLSSLRTLVRQRADMEGSQFVKDSELNAYINSSYAELYDLLVSRFEDYYSKVQSFTLSGTSSQSLPSDFYKVRGLDVQNNGADWSSVRKFNFAERNSASRMRNLVLGSAGQLSYRIMGQSIIFLPDGQADGTYRLWYIPRYTPLVNDSDQLSDVLDFDEYIVIDSAMKCLIKEESDVSTLFTMKSALIKRIEAMASNRDAGTPERVGDVTRAGMFEDLFLPRG